jgi:hypothetical protein
MTYFTTQAKRYADLAEAHATNTTALLNRCDDQLIQPRTRHQPLDSDSLNQLDAEVRLVNYIWGL